MAVSTIWTHLIYKHQQLRQLLNLSYPLLPQWQMAIDLWASGISTELLYLVLQPFNANAMGIALLRKQTGRHSHVQCGMNVTMAAISAPLQFHIYLYSVIV